MPILPVKRKEGEKKKDININTITLTSYSGHQGLS